MKVLNFNANLNNITLNLVGIIYTHTTLPCFEEGGMLLQMDLQLCCI